MMRAEMVARLAAMGYRNAPAIAPVAAIRAGAALRVMAPDTSARFDVLVPRLIEAARASCRIPTRHSRAACDLLEAISRRGGLPGAAAAISAGLAAGRAARQRQPWAADYLAHHPILLDELLDTAPARRRRLAGVSQPAAARLQERSPSTERQMDRLREAHQTRCSAC